MRSSRLLFLVVFDCAVFIYGHDGSNQQGTSGLTSLFICGGRPENSQYLAEAEIIDLEGSNPNGTCNEVPEMPSAKYAAFAIWDDGERSVLCCGGPPTSGVSQWKRCFKYSGSEWIDLGEILKHERYLSSSVELSDGRYWIAGAGIQGGESNSEFYQDGTFSEGPRLPTDMVTHCAVEVSPGFVVISGNGYSGLEKATFGFYPEAGTFERLADMTQGRASHGCGVVNNGDSYDIVVAGGFENGYGYLTHCEIYNTATQEWRSGPTLPQPVGYMSSVQYEDTFLLVGGRNFDQYFDTIYQYDPTTETWILRPERLSTPKDDIGAVLAGPPPAECS